MTPPIMEAIFPRLEDCLAEDVALGEAEMDNVDREGVVLK